MPLGTDSGEVYKNRLDYLVNKPDTRDNNVLDPDINDFHTEDQNVVPPSTTLQKNTDPQTPATEKAQADIPVIGRPTPKGYSNGEYATTPEEFAQDVRQHGMVKTDSSQPGMKEFLGNLPPDIERGPDEGGLIILRVKRSSEPSPVASARKAPDGNWYVDDPNRPVIEKISDVEDRTNESLSDMLKGWIGSKFTMERFMAIMKHPTMSSDAAMYAEQPLPPVTPLGKQLGVEDVDPKLHAEAIKRATDYTNNVLEYKLDSWKSTDPASRFHEYREDQEGLDTEVGRYQDRIESNDRRFFLENMDSNIIKEPNEPFNLDDTNDHNVYPPEILQDPNNNEFQYKTGRPNTLVHKISY